MKNADSAVYLFTQNYFTLFTLLLFKIQYYHVLIFKRALRAHVYSTKPFGKVLISWWVATNKCMYVKHIP